MDEKKKQLGFPDWNPSVQFFHIFRSMIDSGDARTMGAGCVFTYLVVKSYVDFKKGISFPSLETIAVKTGSTVKTTHNHIKKLVEMGYVRKLETKTKHNVYKLVEKIEFEGMDKDSGERVPMRASWDYIPLGVQQAMSDIKNVMIDGELPGGSAVHIQNLSVNIQINPTASTAINQLNLDDIKDKDIRAVFERIMKSQGK